MSDITTMPPILKLALVQSLEAAGFALIPLNGKKPTTKNWGDTKPGEHSATSLAQGNYGVVMGLTDIVIDVDPRNFKPGDKPVTRMAKALGLNFAGTFTVKTGGGGMHLYYKIPAGFVCVNDLKEYPGVEFKSLGRQVVGPGSVHPDSGLEYAVKSGSPDIRLDAPQALLDLIKAPEKEDLDVDAGTGKYINDTGTRERFTSYLKENAEPSVEGQNGDRNAFKVAAHGRDLGLPPETCFELMMAHWNPRCAPEWAPDDLKGKVVNAYKYAAGVLGGLHPEVDFTPLPIPPIREEDIAWDLTPQGLIIKNFRNLLNYLKSPEKGLARVFGYNEFTARVEFALPAPWHNGVMPHNRTVSDNDLKLLKGYLATRWKFEMALGIIEEGVVITAHSNKFHPIREYLSSLTWDKKPRLDNWLHDYCGAESNEYTRAVSRKILVAAVMRVFKPGCKFDHAAVFEGEQGIGKSAVCQILGGEWSGDFTIDPHNKDTIQLMQGRWVIELAELEVARRADNDALKAFISRQVDSARLAYGRLASEFPRQSILIATKNPGADGTYLKDDTGNRRWWPVLLRPKTGMIDFRGLKDARNQLFAEAMMYAQKGERLDMDTDELKDLAKKVVKERHADHSWTERIGAWLETLPPEKDFLTSRDIFIDAMGGVDKQLDSRSGAAIASVMKNLKWEGKVQRVGKRIVRGYQRPAPDPLGDMP